MGMNPGERNSLVDRAKGFGIVLVVIGHAIGGVLNDHLTSAHLFESSMRLIYSFHMPLFFGISGYVFSLSYKKNSFFDDLRPKIYTVAYPYFLWSIVYVLLASFFGKSQEGANLVSIFWAPVGHFWFLHTLFILYFIFILFFHVFNLHAFLALTVFSVISFFASGGELGNQLLSVSYFAIYFYIGYFFSGKICYFYKLSDFRFGFFVSLILFSVVFAFGDLFLLPVFNNFIMAVLGCVVLLFSCVFLKFDILSRLGVLSFPIFITHTFFMWAFRVLCIKLGFVNSLFVLVFSVILSLVLPVVFFRLTSYFKIPLFYLRHS